MPEAADEPLNAPEPIVPPPRRKWRGGLLPPFALVLLAGLLLVWLAREPIANQVIARQLDDLGVQVSYKIESLSPRRPILTDIKFGDPRRPDMTIERIEARISPRFGLPVLSQLRLVRPRLYGTFAAGRVSFGSLDKIIYAETDQPPGLPDFDLVLIDGRARIDSAYGSAGVKIEGSGNLRDGFAGVAAAVVPTWQAGDCNGGRTTFYGKLTSKNARPRFAGPLRMLNLKCPKQGLALGKADASLDLTASEALDGLDGDYNLAARALTLPRAGIAEASIEGQLSIAEGDLTTRYKLAGEQLDAGWALAGSLGSEGMVRSHDRLARIEAEGALEADAVRPSRALDAIMTGAVRSAEGSLLAPLAVQISRALTSEGRASKLTASFKFSQSAAGSRLVVPAASLRGTSGAEVIGISRAMLTLGGQGDPRLVGAIRTGGPGLPQIEGLIQSNRSKAEARLTMREYRAQGTRIALPGLRLVQDAGGAIGFAGSTILSGSLPGGQAENLVLPIGGKWSRSRGLAMWRRCGVVRFDRLAFSNLSVNARALTICPGRGGAILTSDSRGIRLATATTGLDLSGMLGDTEIRLRSDTLNVAWPGALVARGVAVELGDRTDPTRLTLARLDGQLGTDMAGTFAGADMRLNNVPLDVLDAAGDWRFARGDLMVNQGSFVLKDREVEARFQPLAAREASLTLNGSDFTAQAMLREPKSDREIVRAAIHHDLDEAAGHAELDLPGVQFDKKLQPDTLSYLAEGVIALAEGTVSGKGQIDWAGDTVTSRGSFTTDKLDFAAAFGPVYGLSGTVNFSDLLGLVTVPDQQIKIARMTPGIEVDDGELSFQLEPERVLAVNWAKWPFHGGTLTLQPTRMALGVAEVRRYTLKVDGLDAARFVNHLELSNFSVNGVFDGTLPLVFDEEGGRIEGGNLVSREPGGNLSYVGELTYEDMGAMANFAFRSLRSLDYRRMEIRLDGLLEGEIVTKLQFDGLSQGKGSEQSIISRSLAALPIRFNVNVRAPFMSLVSSLRSLYDPEFVRDPRDLGLIGNNGEVPVSNKSPSIQPPASRDTP